MPAHHPTGEHIRTVVQEVYDYFQEPEDSPWRITRVAHLSGYGLPEEVYLIVTHTTQIVVARHPETGKIEPVDTWSYSVLANFEDMHPPQQQEEEISESKEEGYHDE